MTKQAVTERPFSQREVYNHVMGRLGPAQHTWINDPGGAANTGSCRDTVSDQRDDLRAEALSRASHHHRRRSDRT